MDIPHLDKFTIPSLLEHWSSVKPETPAFVFADVQQRVVLTRRDVYTKSKAMGAKLKTLGVNKGDVASYVSLKLRKNTPCRLILEFGLQMAGAVTVDALGQLKNGQDTIERLQETKTKVILTDQTFCSVISDWMNGLNTQITKTEHGFDMNCSFLPLLKHVLIIPDEGLDVGLTKSNDDMEQVEPDDVALIFYTSGSTGRAKGIPYTHHSFSSYLVSKRKQSDVVYKGNRFLCTWHIGFNVGYPFEYLMYGVTRVFWSKCEQDPRTLLDVIVQEKCNAGNLSIPEVQELYDAYTTKECSQHILDNTFIGGQPLTQSISRKILTFSTCLTSMYGLTETFSVAEIIYSQGDDIKENCIGLPLQHCKLMIADCNGKKVTQPNKIGELYIKHPSTTQGYLKPDGSLDKRAFTSDGWLKTDDTSFQDSAGRFYVTGRGSDAILQDGGVFYPHLYETLIRKCPLVEDVAVVAVPDPLLHNVICACVKFAAGVEKSLSVLRTFMSEQFLELHSAHTITPKYYVEFSSFPVTKTFKTDRKELTSLAISQLNL